MFVCVCHFMRAVASSPSHVSLRQSLALFRFLVFFSYGGKEWNGPGSIQRENKENAEES